MWNDEDFTRSGGFDVSGYGSQTTTPAAETNRTSKRPSSIFPVAIRQILDSKDDVMQISGLPVTMMTVVGIVKAIERSTTKISYTIQDWSGSIVGMLWLENNGENQNPAVKEDTYVQVSGTKRNQNGNNVIFIYNIIPVENLSQLTHHYLMVLHIPLKAEENRNRVQDQGDTTVVNNGMTPAQSKVYRVIQQAKSEAGMNKAEILQFSKMSSVELDRIIEFLITEGHVYCTIDDDHYKVTDA